MFNLSEWLRDNLIQSCKERSFTVSQINLMAYNYLTKNQLSQMDFDMVIAVSTEVQAQIDAEIEAQRLAEEQPIEEIIE